MKHENEREVHVEKIHAGKRTYFLDLQEKINGDLVLKMTENRKDNGELLRSTIIVFDDDFDKFFTALERIKNKIR